MGRAVTVPDESVYVAGVRLKTAAEMRKKREDAAKEAPIEGHFISTAKRYGCLQRKLTQFYAEDGWPDRLCVWPDKRGTTDWVELKRPKGGKLEPRQKVIIPELQARGARVEVLRTKEGIDAWFAARAKELRVPAPKEKRKPTNGKLLEVCGVCGGLMHATLSGMVCDKGHGGAEL
jgi:hypothetical protein